MLPCFDLQKPDAVISALDGLKGYWKLWSACLLSSCGLPTLRGFIVTSSYRKMKSDLNRFMDNVGSTAVLIRHDKRLETPPYPRGGFLVGPALLQDAIDFFFALGRIVAVYEKADPLLNMHNMNLLFESDRELWVEVMGPGFDASDLQRGDLSPHETFSVSLSASEAISRVTLVSRVDQTAFDESVRFRKDKIIRKLDSSPTIELAAKIREDLGIPNDLETHLKVIDSPLCHFQSYQPVSQRLLRNTVTKIVKSGVITRYSELSGARFPMNFSTSLVNKGNKQVFWDIVSPSLKFEGLNSVSHMGSAQLK
jgi:hypothetical protein